MKLKQFKVTNFRSVMNSGWIDCDDITSLVGINEAGKSNLILALWKLNPARPEAENKIILRDDMPRHMYTEWKAIPEQIEFISAMFELDDELSKQIAATCSCDVSLIKSVQITRWYDEEYGIEFPDYKTVSEIHAEMIKGILTRAKDEISKLNEISDTKKSESEDDNEATNESEIETEVGINAAIIESLDKIMTSLKQKDTLGREDFDAIKSLYPIDLVEVSNSEIYPKYVSFKNEIAKAFSVFNIKTPGDIQDIYDLVISEMPSFVYYSDYGNLDAEIYLPQAVDLLKKKKITGLDNAAKVRTLRMLFEYVKLNPTEILELGKDPFTQERVVTVTVIEKHDTRYPQNAPITEETTEIVDITPKEVEIKKAQANKSERKIQLNSASSNFTKKLKDWWKQGDYTFMFDADGDYFKIWVSDKNRHDPIELRQRSTGLQWFFSFFLVFLVESQEAHKGTILLLDEAGLTLHPLAQKDLVGFFENLAKDNQLIHTTHSPFLIDTNNIDRVKVVYSDSNGYTLSSNNLREGITSANKNSIYAAHAALGLSVSDVILQGCQPVIVEGTSDQYLLNAIKLYLIQHNKIAPDKELVFLPAGGTSIKGVQGIVGILGAKSEELPPILLDSDNNGESLKKTLLSGLYTGDLIKRIISAKDITGIECSEVEDLIPFELMQKEIERLLRNDEDAEFEYDRSKPILPQIEKFAAENSIVLPNSGKMKVELAKKVKIQLAKLKTQVEDKYSEMWINLFNSFQS